MEGGKLRAHPNSRGGETGGTEARAGDGDTEQESGLLHQMDRGQSPPALAVPGLPHSPGPDVRRPHREMAICVLDTGLLESLLKFCVLSGEITSELTIFL